MKPQQRITRSWFQIYLGWLSKQAGHPGYAPASLEAMREALACAVSGFEHAFPLGGRRNRVIWLCWKSEQGTRPAFFGKTGFARQGTKVRVTAEYLDMGKGIPFHQKLLDTYADMTLQHICHGYALEYQFPEHEAESLCNLLKPATNPFALRRQ